MCVGARRGLAIGLVLAAIIGTNRAFGASPATRPAEDSQFLVPDFAPTHRLNLNADPHLQIGTPDDAPPANPQPPAPPSARVDAISDPLPPALWSGVVMLALAVAFFSLRQLRRQLR